jgi:hypothetical protein
MTAPIPSRPLGPTLTRRAALGMVGGIALAGPAAYALPPAARPGSLLDEVHNRVEPYLELDHAHTGETYVGRFYGAAGYDVAELQKLDSCATGARSRSCRWTHGCSGPWR